MLLCMIPLVLTLPCVGRNPIFAMPNKPPTLGGTKCFTTWLQRYSSKFRVALYAKACSFSYQRSPAWHEWMSLDEQFHAGSCINSMCQPPTCRGLRGYSCMQAEISCASQTEPLSWLISVASPPIFQILRQSLRRLSMRQSRIHQRSRTGKS